MTLYARTEGPPGHPVVVLAGSLGTTLELWEPLLPALTRELRVVRFDHPGHGGTPIPREPFSLDELGAAVLALLDELALERVSFCGLSLGGMVGLWLAARAPARIERLVVACTSARFGPPALWQERADRVRAGGMEAVADSVVARWFTPGFAAAGRYRRLLLATPAEGYARCCEAIRDADLRGELPRIGAPTLVIVGRHDPAVSAEDTAQLAAVNDARVVELDAAHLASVEQPEAFAAAVLDHLGAKAPA